MRKQDAFDSLLAAAGEDPFKFGPKSMNQIREHARQQQQQEKQKETAPTIVVRNQVNVFKQEAPQYTQAQAKKPRQPSIDFSGFEDLEGISPQDVGSQQPANSNDVFDVFSDVGAVLVEAQDLERFSTLDVGTTQTQPELIKQTTSEVDSMEEDLVRIANSQELPNTIHLSRSTPNMSHGSLEDNIGSSDKQRDTISSPSTPPNELEAEDDKAENCYHERKATIDGSISAQREWECEHVLEDVVLPSQARRQGSGYVDNDAIRNVWNGFTKSAKNLSKNISKKVNELVATSPQPQSSPRSSNRGQSPSTQSPSSHVCSSIQEYQEFLAIAVAKMPTEDKRKKFISKLDAEDRQAVLAVFREQRELESQVQSKQQLHPDQATIINNHSNQNQHDNISASEISQKLPDELQFVQQASNQISQKVPYVCEKSDKVNLVSIDSEEDYVRPQSSINVEMVNEPSQQSLQTNAQTAKGGNKPDDLFAFSDTFSSQGLQQQQQQWQQQQQQQQFVEIEDPLAELWGGGSAASQGGVSFLGGDLLGDMEDEELVQLVNMRCEQLAQPGEPLQRKEFRRIRLMEEAKKVKEKMLWKKEMEEREQRAKEDKLRVKGEIQDEITKWKKESTGIQGYLCNLHKVLWEGAEWKQIPLSELLEPGKVRKAYLKAQLVVHPDKVNQKFDGSPPAEIAARADMIASILKESMAQFS